MCSQLAHLRKNKQRFFIVTKCYEKYLKKPGVWALKGKVGKNGEFEYLEVGQTKDIKTELEFIIKLLMEDYSPVNQEKKYAARRLFPKFQDSFDVCNCDKNRRAAKYRTISMQYSEIIFELISENTDRTKREEIEYKFAINNKAKFWNAFGSQRREARKYYNERNNNT